MAEDAAAMAEEAGEAGAIELPPVSQRTVPIPRPFMDPPGVSLVVKIVLRERESANEAVRRFRRLVDRTGLKREMRRREYYEKPSDIRRREKQRAIRRSKMRSSSK